MMRWWVWFWIGVVLAGSSGCSKKVSVKYDASVPADQRQYLESDLQQLSEISIPPNQFSGEAQLFGFSEFSAKNINGWLADRTRYIVGESWDMNSAVSKIASGIAFTPKLFDEVGFTALVGAARDVSAGRLHDDSSSTVQTVMTNVGAAIWLAGKAASILYSIAVAGDRVEVDTLRVKVEQIGPALFGSKRLDGTAIDSFANMCLRQSTVIHEGGHENGNGANAGFPHVQCTSGTYAGNYACEANLNGPYVLGRAFLTQCYYACKTCSPSDLEGLSVYIADLASRLTPDAKWSDPRPEKL